MSPQIPQPNHLPPITIPIFSNGNDGAMNSVSASPVASQNMVSQPNQSVAGYPMCASTPGMNVIRGMQENMNVGVPWWETNAAGPANYFVGDLTQSNVPVQGQVIPGNNTS